jgi:single-strand DNA-binding protein
MIAIVTSPCLEFIIFAAQSEKNQIPNSMVNKVILIGNLGRDPEVRYLEGNVAVAKFSVATNESYKDKKGEWQTNTEWHEIVAWRLLAERAEKQLKKGSQVYVEGKLTHRKYQDKEGNDKYITEVVAMSFRVLDRRDSRPGGSDDDFHAEDSSQDSTTSTGSSGEQQADDDLQF